MAACPGGEADAGNLTRIRFLLNRLNRVDQPSGLRDSSAGYSSGQHNAAVPDWFMKDTKLTGMLY
jgi:hypothetical protein